MSLFITLAIGILYRRFSIRHARLAKRRLRAFSAMKLISGWRASRRGSLTFSGLSKMFPGDYEVADRIPIFQRRPDDGTRPELTRHTFNQGESKTNSLGTATIYHLKSQ